MPKQPSDLPEGQVTPKPESEKRSRRIFSTEYKLRIIAEANACQRGASGAKSAGATCLMVAPWPKPFAVLF